MTVCLKPLGSADVSCALRQQNRADDHSSSQFIILVIWDLRACPSQGPQTHEGAGASSSRAQSSHISGTPPRPLPGRRPWILPPQTKPAYRCLQHLLRTNPYFRLISLLQGTAQMRCSVWGSWAVAQRGGDRPRAEKLAVSPSKNLMAGHRPFSFSRSRP